MNCLGEMVQAVNIINDLKHKGTFAENHRGTQTAEVSYQSK